jgi:hypothetical protein
MIKIRILIAALMCAMAFVLYSILISQIMPKAYAAAPPTPTPTPVAIPASTPTATPSSLWTEEDMRAVFPEKYASPKLPVRLLKSRVVTHSPEDMGDVPKAELDPVLKAIKVIKWSRNADPVAAANEDYKSIVKYCADHNVDLTADLVTEAASGNYYPGNDDANARYQMTMDKALLSGAKTSNEAAKYVPGPTPETGGICGVSLEVHNAIKAKLRDPELYKYESCSDPVWTTFGQQPCWKIEVRFGARNGFGGYSEGSASVWVFKWSDSAEEKVWGVEVEQ